MTYAYASSFPNTGGEGVSPFTFGRLWAGRDRGPWAVARADGLRTPLPGRLRCVGRGSGLLYPIAVCGRQARQCTRDT